jgi:hypothetical protein
VEVTEILTEVVIERDRVPEVVREKDIVPGVLIEREIALEDLKERDLATEVLTESDITPEFVIEGDKVPEVLIEREITPEVVIEREITPEVVILYASFTQTSVEEDTFQEQVQLFTKTAKLQAKSDNVPDVTFSVSSFVSDYDKQSSNDNIQTIAEDLQNVWYSCL